MNAFLQIVRYWGYGYHSHPDYLGPVWPPGLDTGLSLASGLATGLSLDSVWLLAPVWPQVCILPQSGYWLLGTDWLGYWVLTG